MMANQKCGLARMAKESEVEFKPFILALYKWDADKKIPPIFSALIVQE